MIRDTSRVQHVIYHKNNNFLITKNQAREVSFWNLNQKEPKKVIFAKSDNKINVLEYFKNLCRQEVVVLG